MFWKIALVLGILGVIFGIIISIVSYRTLTLTNDPNTEDIALSGMIFGVALMLLSFLLIFISIIFVLRASKKDFDAKNPK